MAAGAPGVHPEWDRKSKIFIVSIVTFQIIAGLIGILIFG